MYRHFFAGLTTVFARQPVVEATGEKRTPRIKTTKGLPIGKIVSKPIHSACSRKNPSKPSANSDSSPPGTYSKTKHKALVMQCSVFFTCL